MTSSDYVPPSADILVLRAVGPATDGGRLPLSELARLASGLQATLERLALSIYGRDPRPGRRPREIVEAVRLDCVGFDFGSVALKIARPQRPSSTGELLESSLSALENGLLALRRTPDEIPQFFNPQVTNGLRDLTGAISPSGVARVELYDNGQLRFTLDQELNVILRKIRFLTIDEFSTVVGRLHMGDFSPAVLRCRIDTYAGSVLCDFDYDLRERVLDAMDQLVIAHGAAELEPNGAVHLLHIAGIQVIESAESVSLDELARSQGIRPIQSAEELRGEPIDDFDIFLRAIESARGGDE